MGVIHTDREALKAYPATLTFRDLMRKNRRRSVVLVGGIIAIAVVLGGSLGAVVGSSGGEGGEALLVGTVLGGLVALVLATSVSVWSWRSGDKAILRMARAVELSQEADRELFNIVDELRIAAGVPMPRVYVIPTDSLNAFATGRSPETASVAVTKGLREQLDRDELAGVIAHEMAHIRHDDVRLMMLLATLVGVIVLACDAAREMLWHMRWSNLPKRSSSRSKGGGGAIVVIALVVFVLLVVVSPILATMLQMAVSREREYLADAGAVELTRYPEGLASALEKLAAANKPYKTANRAMTHLFIVPPKGVAIAEKVGGMFKTHPPTEERIRRLLALTR
jgi:heat shock protein HtpX